MEEQLNGFIKIDRKMINWEWYDDTVTKAVFLHLLLTASFKPVKWHGVEILPGQLITSYGSLSKKLHLTEKQIRTSINKLKGTGEVAVKWTNKFSLVTVVNWDKFQSNSDDGAGKRAGNWAPKGQAEGRQRAGRGQHRKNVKNVKNVKNILAVANDEIDEQGRSRELLDKPWSGTSCRDNF